ncbi:MAG: glycosyltransferase [Pseudomonadota bacterium]
MVESEMGSQVEAERQFNHRSSTDAIVGQRPKLLFVSPQFLFPMDAGGKIRTANILRQLKGGVFEIALVSPGSAGEVEKWGAEIDRLCDSFEFWPNNDNSVVRRLRRLSGLLTPLPVSVRVVSTRAAQLAVERAVSHRPDLIVYDYIHSFVLRPDWKPIGGNEAIQERSPEIIFTHNVETEIFQRHRELASFPMQMIYGLEAVKMKRFEAKAASTMDGVIAVSDKDADNLRNKFGAKNVQAIPTGVDLKFFSFDPPQEDAAPVVTFTGSMDWRANQEGLAWFLSDVWPKIANCRPDASFTIVGKNPPETLVNAAKAAGARWTFTGFVDDVRAHARGAVYVIPIRAGSGTRIKAFEAMAMGVPVVSTAVGIEGLNLTPDAHYLEANDAEGFAAAVIQLLDDGGKRYQLAKAARARVEAQHSHAAAAQVFEKYCSDILTEKKR